MDLQSLKKKVGIKRYNAACREARKAAPYCGMIGSPRQERELSYDLAALQDMHQLVGDMSDEV